MAKIQETRSFNGKSAADAYAAVLKAVPVSGLSIWKQRDIAWLVMVRGGSGSDAIDGNISVRPGSTVTVSLSDNAPDPAGLKQQAEKVFIEITRLLG